MMPSSMDFQCFTPIVCICRFRPHFLALTLTSDTSSGLAGKISTLPAWMRRRRRLQKCCSPPPPASATPPPGHAVYMSPPKSMPYRSVKPPRQPSSWPHGTRARRAASWRPHAACFIYCVVRTCWNSPVKPTRALTPSLIVARRRAG